MHPLKSRIPDRWGDYSNFKGVIEECHILPCKTPLNQDLFRHGISDGILTRDQSFTTDNLCQMVEENLQSSVEFVIDFTNTSRYYVSRDFENRGIKHIKIECVGKQIPSQDVYKRFHNAMDKCLQLITPQGVIAVHCTHGLNRSGFLVCNYLINKYNYSVDEAVQIFNEARGHDIERTEYIEKLKRGKYPTPTNNTFEFIERPVETITTDSIAAPVKEQDRRSRKPKRERRKSNHQSPRKHRSSAKQQPSREPHSHYKSYGTHPHHGQYHPGNYGHPEKHASYYHHDSCYPYYPRDRHSDYQDRHHPHSRYHEAPHSPYYTYDSYPTEYPPAYEYSRRAYTHTPVEYPRDTYYHPPPSHLPPNAWGPPTHPSGCFQQSSTKHHSNQGDIRTYTGVPYIKH